MRPILIQVASQSPAADPVLSDPGLLAAENRFFQVVTRLCLEDANHRAELALARVGCVIVHPPAPQPV